MKNVLLIHGFNGTPPIFHYFKQELEKQNYNVILPDFPVKDEITVEEYFNVFDKYQSYFNKDLIVVAHSIGNPMFIKYIVPFKLLEEFCQDIASEAMLIKNIGHMGKKSGLEELPEVIKMIYNQV